MFDYGLGLSLSETNGLCLFKYTQRVCNECHCQAFVGHNVLVDTVVIAECSTRRQRHHDVPAVLFFLFL